jgi:hypothetical protein
MPKSDDGFASDDSDFDGDMCDKSDLCLCPACVMGLSESALADRMRRMDAASAGIDVERYEKKLEEQKVVVRELQTAGAPRHELQAALQVLMELKSAVTNAKGGAGVGAKP